MTVQELFDVSESRIKVMSGYNGKILCHEYSPDKHKVLSEREVVAVWSEMKVIASVYGNYAKAIMSVYVNGKEEYDKEHEKDNEHNH